MVPGTAAIDNVIDFKTKHGTQLYDTGSAAFPTAINLKAQGILLFQRELQERHIRWDQQTKFDLFVSQKNGGPSPRKWRISSLFVLKSRSSRALTSSFPGSLLRNRRTSPRLPRTLARVETSLASLLLLQIPRTRRIQATKRSRRRKKHG
jgi:hypothetical protein